MAGNVTGIHQFADDVGPLPLKLLDDSFSALNVAINTLSTYSNFYADGGTTNQLTVQTPNTQYASLTDGLTITTRVAATNTGPATLNVNGLGAMPILTGLGSELEPNALLAGSMVTFIYNAARQAWQIEGSAGGGVISAPFSVTSPDGQQALAINNDGSGYIGDFNGCGLAWDAACNFNFEGGAGIRSMAAPFMVTTADGSRSILQIQEPVNNGDCIVLLDPGDPGLNLPGVTLCVVGAPDYNALVVSGSAMSQPYFYAARIAADCTTDRSCGLLIQAGTTANDSALTLKNCAGEDILDIRGDGSVAIGAAPNQLVSDASGNFTLTGTAQFPGGSIATATDVALSNLANGQSLVYNATTQKWENSTPVTALAALSDVALSNLANGQSLVYNSTTQTWINGTPVTTLESLTNTHISGTQPGQVLTYSINPQPGWVNASIPGYSFLTSLSIQGAPQPGFVLTWDGSGWVGAAPGQITINPLGGLADVVLSSPVINRNVLTYDAPNDVWINAPVPQPALSALPDVSVSGQTQGQVLAWDNTLHRWVNSALPGGSVIALDTLMDTNISDPQNNQVLTWDYASARWVNRALPISPVITSPQLNQTLYYNGTTWVNGPVPQQALAGLSDVGMSALSNGQVLTYNGTNWVNGPPAAGTLAGLTDVTITSPAVGQPIVYAGSNRYQNSQVMLLADYGLRVTDGSNNYIQGTTAAVPAMRIEWANTSNAMRGAAIMTNSATSSTQQVTTAPSWVMDLGGRLANGTTWSAANSDAFTIFRVPPGGSYLTSSNSAPFRIAADGSGYLGFGAGSGTNAITWDAATVPTVTVPGVFKVAGVLQTYVTGGGEPGLRVNAVAGNYPTLICTAKRNTFQAFWCGTFLDTVSDPGNSFGVMIQAGTAGSDSALSVRNAAGVEAMRVTGARDVVFNQMGQGGGDPLYLVNSTLRYWPAASALRFKQDIKIYKRSAAREFLSKVRLVSFRYRPDAKIDDKGVTHCGLLAEDVEAADPYFVTYEEDGRLRGVKYQELVKLLIPLVQELLGMNEPEEVDYG